MAHWSVRRVLNEPCVPVSICKRTSVHHSNLGDKSFVTITFTFIFVASSMIFLSGMNVPSNALGGAC